MTNKDKTGTARQQARRLREKQWLAAHGFTSWESLHTNIMNGNYILIAPDNELLETLKKYEETKGKHS